MLDDDRRRDREAATEALEQLDWCIGYLHAIRKRTIAARLARNRAHIRRNLLRQPAEHLPVEGRAKPDRAVVRR